MKDVCPNCNKKAGWRTEPKLYLSNPNGEYVEGYGHMPVMLQNGENYFCMACGWMLGGNPKKISIIVR